MSSVYWILVLLTNTTFCFTVDLGQNSTERILYENRLACDGGCDDLDLTSENGGSTPTWRCVHANGGNVRLDYDHTEHKKGSGCYIRMRGKGRAEFSLPEVNIPPAGACLTFWEHISSNSSLEVKIITSSHSDTRTVTGKGEIWKLENPWRQHQEEIGRPGMTRVCFVGQKAKKSDVALDDISITSGPCQGPTTTVKSGKTVMHASSHKTMVAATTTPSKTNVPRQTTQTLTRSASFFSSSGNSKLAIATSSASSISSEESRVTSFKDIHSSTVIISTIGYHGHTRSLDATPAADSSSISASHTQRRVLKSTNALEPSFTVPPTEHLSTFSQSSTLPFSDSSGRNVGQSRLSDSMNSKTSTVLQKPTWTVSNTMMTSRLLRDSKSKVSQSSTFVHKLSMSSMFSMSSSNIVKSSLDLSGSRRLDLSGSRRLDLSGSRTLDLSGSRKLDLSGSRRLHETSISGRLSLATFSFVKTRSSVPNFKTPVSSRESNTQTNIVSLSGSTQSPCASKVATPSHNSSSERNTMSPCNVKTVASIGLTLTSASATKTSLNNENLLPTTSGSLNSVGSNKPEAFSSGWAELHPVLSSPSLPSVSQTEADSVTTRREHIDVHSFSSTESMTSTDVFANNTGVSGRPSSSTSRPTSGQAADFQDDKHDWVLPVVLVLAVLVLLLFVLMIYLLCRQRALMKTRTLSPDTTRRDSQTSPGYHRKNGSFFHQPYHLQTETMPVHGLSQKRTLPHSFGSHDAGKYRTILPHRPSDTSMAVNQEMVEMGTYSSHSQLIKDDTKPNDDQVAVTKLSHPNTDSTTTSYRSPIHNGGSMLNFDNPHYFGFHNIGASKSPKANRQVSFTIGDAAPRSRPERTGSSTQSPSKGNLDVNGPNPMPQSRSGFTPVTRVVNGRVLPNFAKSVSIEGMGRWPTNQHNRSPMLRQQSMGAVVPDEDDSLGNGHFNKFETLHDLAHIGPPDDNFSLRRKSNSSQEDDASSCSGTGENNKDAAKTIPTIILTKSDTESDIDHNDGASISHELFHRPKRIQRANNPFMIEIDQQGPSSFDRARRLSAPTISTTPPLETNALIGQEGIMRAGSSPIYAPALASDQSPRHFRDRPDLHSWSTDFFEFMKHINTKESSKEQVERFKRMIDERYELLLGRKYSIVDKLHLWDPPQTYPGNLSPRIGKRIGEPDLRCDDVRGRRADSMSQNGSEHDEIGTISKSPSCSSNEEGAPNWVSEKPGHNREVMEESTSSTSPLNQDYLMLIPPNHFPDIITRAGPYGQERDEAEKDGKGGTPNKSATHATTTTNGDTWQASTQKQKSEESPMAGDARHGAKSSESIPKTSSQTSRERHGGERQPLKLPLIGQFRPRRSGLSTALTLRQTCAPLPSERPPGVINSHHLLPPSPVDSVYESIASTPSSKYNSPETPRQDVFDENNIYDRIDDTRKFPSSGSDANGHSSPEPNDDDENVFNTSSKFDSLLPSPPPKKPTRHPLRKMTRNSGNSLNKQDSLDTQSDIPSGPRADESRAVDQTVSEVRHKLKRLVDSQNSSKEKEESVLPVEPVYATINHSRKSSPPNNSSRPAIENCFPEDTHGHLHVFGNGMGHTDEFKSFASKNPLGRSDSEANFDKCVGPISSVGISLGNNTKMPTLASNDPKIPGASSQKTPRRINPETGDSLKISLV